MTSDRIKEIQKETAYPDSVSVQQGLLKVWNECEHHTPSINEAADILQALMEYGNLRPVKGVIYGDANHEVYLKRALIWLHLYKTSKRAI